MNISASTLYLNDNDRGCPEKYLRMMAEAGFSHVMWCFHWRDDFLYSTHEIAAYKKMMTSCGLTMLDIHGTAGDEKCWFSMDEYCRKAGVELVENRMVMLAEMESQGVLTLHVPCYCAEWVAPEDQVRMRPMGDALKRSIAELLPSMEKYNVKIALENSGGDSFQLLSECMREFPAEYVGITFDAGHANLFGATGFERIKPWKDRIYAIHLHDNDGNGDWHQPPFFGNVKWEEFFRFLKNSSYRNVLNFEFTMKNTPLYIPELREKQPEDKVKIFLADAYARCRKAVELYNTL